jgi:uncharacterized protein (DUF1499 family)
MRLVAWIGILFALASAALLALAPLGWRVELWPFSTSFLLLRWAAYGAIAGALASLAALVRWRALSRSLRVGAIVAIVVSAVVFYMPWHFTLAAGASIHDIATDTDNPPAFEAVLAARKAANAATADYPGSGPNTAQIQKQAYPDIAPLLLKAPPPQVFALALATAQTMPRWTIDASDAARGRIEASARTLWMGFTDDIVIRITADGAGSRVDMRSLSRVGRGDFGANAARIRTYLAALRARAG